MDNTYSSSSWHYTDSDSGQVPDLHHLMMYKSLGGGELNHFCVVKDF